MATSAHTAVGAKAAAKALRSLQRVLEKGERAEPLQARAAIEAVLGAMRELSPERREGAILYLRTTVAAEEAARIVAGEPSLSSAAELLEHARIEGEAKRLVHEQPMLTARDVGKLLGTASASNPRKYANHLRGEGKLLGVPHKNTYVYPAFQFDVRRRRLRGTVARMNQLLDARRDPFGATSWWITPSERLGDRAPVDVLGTNDEALLEPMLRADLAPIG